jgi:hypothetical protein
MLAHITLFALFTCVAATAQPAMYKWTDADGNTTFSNQPPADTSYVTDFTKIEDTPAARTEPALRTPPASAASPAIVRPSPALTPPPTALPQPEPSLTRPSPSPASIDPSARPETASAPRDTDIVKRETESTPRVPSHRVETEAVRDPCLRSSDPKCHERHKDRYHPYFGYAPSVMQPGGTAAVGATAGSSAGGTVSGRVTTAPPATGAALRRGDSVPTPVTGSVRWP